MLQQQVSRLCLGYSYLAMFITLFNIHVLDFLVSLMPQQFQRSLKRSRQSIMKSTLLSTYLIILRIEQMLN